MMDRRTFFNSSIVTGITVASVPFCAFAGSMDRDMQRRIVRANQYISGRPGVVGYVLGDRRYKAVYASTYAMSSIWTASTIKLMMVTDLLERNHWGWIRLRPRDWRDMDAMLYSSDDDAADRLWRDYAGDDRLQFNRDAARFGMTNLVPQANSVTNKPYWGFQKCTPWDLYHLMMYVLEKLYPAGREYVVHRMRTVAPDQQWGVWTAGRAGHPGNKDGWSGEISGAIANTVGFYGPRERYVLAVMNTLNGHGRIIDGQYTTSGVARILLEGRN